MVLLGKCDRLDVIGVSRCLTPMEIEMHADHTLVKQVMQQDEVQAQLLAQREKLVGYDRQKVHDQTLA